MRKKVAIEKMANPKKYEWSKEKWLQDETWWTPYNKSGRLKGKGSTSWARAARRAAETSEQREERKRLRDEKQKASSSEPLQKEATQDEPKEGASSKPLQKEAEESSQLLKKEAEESSKPLKKEAQESSKPLKKGAQESSQPLKKEAEESSKPLKKEAQESSQPLKKEAEESSKPLKKEAPAATYKEVLVGWKDRAGKQWVLKPQKAPEPPSEERTQAKNKGGSQNKQEKEKKRRTKVGYVSLGASSSSESEENTKPLKKVAVDWHNVIQVWSQKQGDHVPDAHIRAIWDLQAEEIKVVLISFAGPGRGDEVEEWARSLPVRFDEIIICSKKTGWKGKADIALELGCECIIDDDADICWESLKKGLKAMPIQTWKQKHEWAAKHKIEPYRAFPDAVRDLVSMQRSGSS